MKLCKNAKNACKREKEEELVQPQRSSLPLIVCHEGAISTDITCHVKSRG